MVIDPKRPPVTISGFLMEWPWNHTDQGNGGTVGTFPADRLSTDKAKAGVVRIPKPGFLDR